MSALNSRLRAIAADIKLKWIVQPAPTGLSRVSTARRWPMAEYKNGKLAAMLACATPYSSSVVNEAKHEPIYVYIAFYDDKSFNWRKMTKTFKTIEDAKYTATNFINAHPEIQPK